MWTGQKVWAARPRETYVLLCAQPMAMRRDLTGVWVADTRGIEPIPMCIELQLFVKMFGWSPPLGQQKCFTITVNEAEWTGEVPYLPESDPVQPSELPNVQIVNPV